MIWKHPKYVEGRKFYELFDSKKNFGARALPRARAQNILPPMPKNHDFLVFTAMWDSTRAARASARASKFFGNAIVMTNSFPTFFGLAITQKANFLKQFEVWTFLWQLDYFSNFENFQFFKILRKSRIFTNKKERKKIINIEKRNFWSKGGKKTQQKQQKKKTPAWLFLIFPKIHKESKRICNIESVPQLNRSYHEI